MEVTHHFPAFGLLQAERNTAHHHFAVSLSAFAKNLCPKDLHVKITDLPPAQCEQGKRIAGRRSLIFMDLVVHMDLLGFLQRNHLDAPNQQDACNARGIRKLSSYLLLDGWFQAVLAAEI